MVIGYQIVIFPTKRRASVIPANAGIHEAVHNWDIVGATHASPEMQIWLTQMSARHELVGEACLAPTADCHAFTIMNRTL